MRRELLAETIAGANQKRHTAPAVASVGAAQCRASRRIGRIGRSNTTLPAGDEGYKGRRILSANDASISSLQLVYRITGTYVMVEDYPSYLRLLLPPR